jgi:hypothetical protein
VDYRSATSLALRLYFFAAGAIDTVYYLAKYSIYHAAEEARDLGGSPLLIATQ